jgi:two-component system OmpR family response regulator
MTGGIMERKILVVDDEKKIVDIVKAYLERERYQVIVAYDGEEALDMAREQQPALLVLDLMLPGISGWDVCRILRKESDIPIIMLTARDEVTDKIVGLELGADDYVTKPFDPKELVSRVKSVLRRSQGSATYSAVLKVGELSIDVEKRMARISGEAVELTSTEFDLLKTMAQHPGRVYSRMKLLDEIQGDSYEGYERTIDSHIKNLRKKIEPDPNHPRHIITVYGVGYKLQENSDA